MTGRLVLASLAVYPAAWGHPNIWAAGWALTLGVLVAGTTWWTQVNSAEITALRREIATRPDLRAYAARAVLVLAPLAACIYLGALDPRDRIIVDLIRHVRHLEVRVAGRHAIGRRPAVRAA